MDEIAVGFFDDRASLDKCADDDIFGGGAEKTDGEKSLSVLKLGQLNNVTLAK